MFETARRSREIDRLLVIRQCEESVNQTRGETIAAAYAVHNMSDVVVPAQQERLAVVQARGPAIMRSGFRFAQSNRNGLQPRKLFQDFRGELFILPAIELARMNVYFGLDVQRHL